MKLLLAILPVALFVAAFSIAVRVLSSRNREEESFPFPLGSMILIGVSIYAIAMVAAATFVPGGTGPVQYVSGSTLATFFFSQRVSTILAMMLFPIVAGIAGLIRFQRHQKMNKVMTVAGIAAWGVAWIVLFANLWFWPRV